MNSNTIPPDTASPQADPDKTPRILFNDPDADLVLRSCDSHTFRVLKLFIIRSSSVLGEMIQAASDTFGTANSTSAEKQLPEVQLCDSSTICSCLLTFIFPEPFPVIPSSLEEKMELLSVAQKYEMNSVIDHIRGSLSMQDPPFIHRENAFFAYSLAQRYGLRREAVQAARLTLKFTLTIEKFGDVIPGAYLHQLWNYHQRVQAWLKHDLPLSGVGDVLKAFKCSQTATTGPPHWVNSYIRSITENPSFFDPIEFQMALMRHTTGGLPVVSIFGFGNTVTAGCSLCTNIPAENMRTFWMNLTAIVHRSMERAEDGLTFLGTESSPRIYEDSIAHSFPLPECLDISGADVILQSSDHAKFLMHKAILASSSPVFRDIFSLPQPPNSGLVDGLPVVDISEDAGLVGFLITFLYPIPSKIPTSWDRTLALLSAAQKYDMGAIQASIRGEVARRKLPALDGTQAFRAFAIASNSRLLPEMKMAASLTLDSPMTFEHLGGDLQLFERSGLHELANFRKSCRDQLVTCFQTFLDPLKSPSNIWTGCPGERAEPSIKDTPTLPVWVHAIFTQQIEDLKQDFTRPLANPSILRAKYLQALGRHAACSYPGRCIFCLEVHALKGEDYCAQLEQAITRAREKPRVAFRE